MPSPCWSTSQMTLSVTMPSCSPETVTLTIMRSTANSSLCGILPSLSTRYSWKAKCRCWSSCWVVLTHSHLCSSYHCQWVRNEPRLLWIHRNSPDPYHLERRHWLSGLPGNWWQVLEATVNFPSWVPVLSLSRLTVETRNLTVGELAFFPMKLSSSFISNLDIWHPVPTREQSCQKQQGKAKNRKSYI